MGMVDQEARKEEINNTHSYLVGDKDTNKDDCTHMRDKVKCNVNKCTNVSSLKCLYTPCQIKNQS